MKIFIFITVSLSIKKEMSRSCRRCKITDFLTGTLYIIKNRKKSLTFHANCRNSSPTKLLRGRITRVGENPRRVQIIISTFSFEVEGEKWPGSTPSRCNYEGCEIVEPLLTVSQYWVLSTASIHMFQYFTATAVFSQKIWPRKLQVKLSSLHQSSK